MGGVDGPGGKGGEVSQPLLDVVLVEVRQDEVVVDVVVQLVVLPLLPFGTEGEGELAHYVRNQQLAG